ncbi:MAG: SLC13 family permease [Acidimicrobiia bacterium]|jgi:di/tricarboxylate transporter|nr:SLC13 family permease [Acidimicrobiia bacterium]MBP8181525.1 SLC13 family permease [Acidimicrobiia bacterium]
MASDAAITLGVLVLVFGTLASDRFPPSGVLLGGLVVLIFADVIDPQTGVSGFANPAPLTVAALYVVAAGARRTGLLAGLTGRVLGGSGGRASIARLCVPVAGLSSVFNNTPLVAMLLPEVSSWARSRRLPVSRFLMPLSFAAILGGVITLIGTSTNLVVSGVLEQQGHRPFGLFELTPVGLPAAVAGLFVLVFVAQRLIPDRSDPTKEALESLRNFALHLEVDERGPLVGQTVTDAGLRHLSGVYLADIVRDERHIGPVAPDEVLEADDLLIFVGDVSDVLDLRSRAGLVVPKDQAAVLESAREPLYFEAVVGRESELVGRTLKEVGGREGYRAAAVAIHRAGEAVAGKLGNVELLPADTLVLLAGRDLRKSLRAQKDFLVISPLAHSVPVISRRARWVALALAVFVICASFKLTTTLEAAWLAAGIVVCARVVTYSEAKRAIDLDVILMIAASLGIGAAVDSSGLAQDIAEMLTGSLGFAGTLGVIAGILLTTTLLTEIVTNNAAAAVVVPIAIRAAEDMDLDYRVMAVGVAVMASASFLTPIGYQTNAMIYGPGGYKFFDFVRVGGPINLTFLVMTTAMVFLLG